MGVDKIVKLVGVLVAVVAGLMGGFAYSATLVALLGLVGGYFIAADDRMRFLVVTVAVGTAAGALGGGVIPVVGDYIAAAMGGLVPLFAAAAVTVIVMGIVDAVKP
jgi:hypothetical protein